MSFAKDVNQFVLDVGDANEKIVRATVIQLWAGIIKASPVDTGRFRANWFASGETPSPELNLRLSSGTRAIQRATKKVKAQESTEKFTLTNNLPYGEVIEFGGYGPGPNTVGGFSKQAPQGVVRVTIQRFNELIKKNAAKHKV